jgi:hypothetical protein
LAGGYFFLLADFLAAGFLALDFCCFDLADLVAIMLLVFCSLTPLRHVSFPAEEPSMPAGAAAVNHRGEVIARVLTEFVPLSKLMAEQIGGLRNWAKGRARLATSLQSERKLRRIVA